MTRFIYDGDGARILRITGEGMTVYIGEVYEEFIPGLGGWQEQTVAARVAPALVAAPPRMATLVTPPRMAAPQMAGGVQPAGWAGRRAWAGRARSAWPLREQSTWLLREQDARLLREQSTWLLDEQRTWLLEGDGVPPAAWPPAGRAALQGGGPITVQKDAYHAQWDADGLRFTLTDQGKPVPDKSVAVQVVQVRSGSYEHASRESLRTSPSLDAAGRVNYQRTVGVDEEHMPMDLGVEQVFVLREPLALDGDLEIAVQLTGPGFALKQAAWDEVWVLDREGNPAFRYVAPLAYDSQNWACPLKLRIEGDRIIIRVAADWLSRAAYPVFVDPFLTGDFAIYTGAQHQQMPKVAYNSTDNQYLVVWRDLWREGDNGRWDIYGRRLYANGNWVDAERFLIAQEEGYSPAPQVTFNPVAGEYLVVWNTSNSHQVRAQRVSRTGSLSGSQIQVISTNPDPLDPGVAVACNTQAGNYLVGWTVTHTGHYSTYVRLVTGGGLTPTTPVNIAPGLISAHDRYPGIAYNSAAGEYMVVWMAYAGTDWDVYGQRVAAGGVLMTGTSHITVYTGSSNQYAPSIAYSSRANQYLVAWQVGSWGYGTDIRARRLSSTEGVLGSDIDIALVGNTYHHFPKVAYHEAGNEYLVVWESGNELRPNGDYNIYGARVSVSGTVLSDGGATNLVVCNASAGQFSAHASCNSQEAEFLIVWDDYRNGSYADIYGRLYAPPDEAAPEGWTGFQPAGWQTTTNVAVSIQVTDWYTGLNGGSAQVQYQPHGGSWSGWQAATCSGCGAGPHNTATLQATVPLADGPNNQVKFKVCDRGGLCATSGAYTVQVDASPPPIPTMQAEPAYTPGTSNTVTWGAVTDGGVGGVAQYRAQRATDSSFTTGVVTTGWQSNLSYTFTGLGGNCQPYYYRVRSRDALNNTSGWSGYVTSIQDNVAPASGSVTVNGGASWTNSPTVTLSLSAGDACSPVTHMRIWNDGQAEPGTWLALTTPYPWTLPGADGLHTVYVRFKDAAGNPSASVYSDTINLDTHPPTNGIVTVNGGALWTRSRSVTLTLSASDPSPGSGVTHMRIWNGGQTEPGTWLALTTPYPWTLPDADGLCTVKARFRDGVGNASAVYMDSITLDRVPPSLVVTQPAEGLILGVLPLSVKGQSEVWATLCVHALESGWHPCLNLDTADFVFNLFDLVPGSNTLLITATDRAGNSTAVQRHVTYDSVGPQIGSLTPTGATAASRPLISASFTVTGGAAISVTSVVVRVDNDDVTCSATVTAGGFVYTPTNELPEGQHQAQVKVYDTAGNDAARTWYFEVDLSTWVTIARPSGGLNRLNAAVEGKAEPGAAIAVSVSGGAAVTTTADGTSGCYEVENVAFSTGVNTLIVTATDALAHVAVATATVTVDLSAPWADAQAQPETFSPGGAIGHTTFDLTATAPSGESLSAWQFRVVSGSTVITQAGGAGAPVSTLYWDGRDEAGQPLAEGTYLYALAVTATNGRAYTCSLRAVWIDLTPPTSPTITRPDDGSDTDLGLIWVEGTAEPGVFITLLDGGLFTTTLECPADPGGRWAGEYPLHDGVNHIVAIANDTTGVSSPPSNQVSVYHRVKPPLYEVGVTPPTVAAGETVTLWADVRGISPTLGAPTTAAWAVLPFGEDVVLTGTTPNDPLWHWDGTWAVPGGASSQDTTVYYRAVDGDNRQGNGEVGLAIRNVPPAPEINLPDVGYVTGAQLLLDGQVWSAEQLTVRVYDERGGQATQVGQARSTSWDGTVGVNWQTVVTLTAEGEHPLYAQAQSDYGLVSLSGTVRVVVLDLYPPTVTLSALPAYTNALSLSLAWQGDDGAGSGMDVYMVEHQFAGGGWTVWASGGEGYTSSVYPLFQEGTYSLRVRGRDRAGREGVSAVQTVVADRSVPDAALGLVENSPYASLSGSTLYYGPGSGIFTLTVAMTDSTAGLNEIVFPATVSDGATYPQNGANNATIVHAYAFDANDTASATYNVTITDRATNFITVPFSVLRDAISPTVALTVPSRPPTPTFLVQWSAQETGSGLHHYHVQYKVDAGDWQLWFTATTQTQATFAGEMGQAYAFRVRATDNVSNTSTWVEDTTKTVVVKKYYSIAGQRVAMRVNDVVYWLHGDHLGSTSLTTDASGNVAAEQRYLPYGEVRWVTGTLPTDLTYTGQRADSYTQLVGMGARWYSPRLGRWISPDSIIPNLANPQSLNRYSYVYNRPIRYTDPTGYDPLDKEWEDAFKSAHGGREPNDQDRRDRLFSLIFLGSGPNGTWTEDDWAKYNARRQEYWAGELPWPGASSPGLDRFLVHLERLASHYKPNEQGQFAKAVGFVWGRYLWDIMSSLPGKWQPIQAQRGPSILLCTKELRIGSRFLWMTKIQAIIMPVSFIWDTFSVPPSDIPQTGCVMVPSVITTNRILAWAIRLSIKALCYVGASLVLMKFRKQFNTGLTLAIIGGHPIHLERVYPGTGSSRWRGRLMHKVKPLILLMSVLALVGCTIHQIEPTPEIPTLPPLLLDLPLEAQVDCDLKSGVFVWQFPGIEPPDPNSAYRGHRGKELGVLPGCTVVTISDYTWSEMDREFWVYVQAENLEGWVPLEFLDLTQQSEE